MARRKANENRISQSFPRAKNRQERENQMIELAVVRAEEQIRNGTASSQVLVHYLKLATTREKLEQEKLRQENEMLKAKTKAYENSEDVKRLMEEALHAMRSYSGSPEEDDDVDE